MTTTIEAATAPKRAPKRPEHGPGSKADGWSRRFPLLPALVFTFIITQLPFVVTIYYSLESWNLVRPGSRHFVGLSNYAQVFTDSQFRRVTLNTVVLTVGAVLIAVALGLLLALMLNRAFPGRGVVRTLLITPFLITPVAAALLWKTTLLDPTYGLVNFVLSPFGAGKTDWISSFPLTAVMMAIVWQWTPFMMLLILAGLQSQPADVLEAAGVDGASNFAIFREITIP
ncbi:MAG: polyol transport system permease protein, partial [Pseudonocardiales bacterium]|nr:polyol transport system permease protein [Pseudonocardiales bacterium]